MKIGGHVDEKNFSFYQLSDITVLITGYQGDSTEVKIPSKIHGFTVVGISEEAFSNPRDLCQTHSLQLLRTDYWCNCC